MGTKVDYPFIYIASLMRTGSTVLQELLTSLPHSFIFHEPRLGEGKFDIKDKFLSPISHYNVNIKGILGKRPTIEKFATLVVPELKKHIKQIGVKEIDNPGWEQYVKYFPDMCAIIIGREPKDLYFSIYKWTHKNGKQVKPFKGGKFLVQRVKEKLLLGFTDQVYLHSKAICLKVRYEDLCLKSSEVKRIQQFVQSPQPNIGEIGGFLSTNKKRINEHQQHQGKITTTSIGNWRSAPPEIIDEILEFDEKMVVYKKFWGYE